jgi:Tautomerase enzyme
VPLARIGLAEGQSTDYRRTIGEVVYDAMIEILNVPENDRFQVISEHAAGDFIFDSNYLGIQRSKDCVFIQVTLNAGRTLDQKSAFYKVQLSSRVALADCEKQNRHQFRVSAVAAPRQPRGCAASAPWLRRVSAVAAPRQRRGCAASAPWLRCGCAASAPRTLFRRAGHAGFRDRFDGGTERFCSSR